MYKITHIEIIADMLGFTGVRLFAKCRWPKTNMRHFGGKMDTNLNNLVGKRVRYETMGYCKGDPLFLIVQHIDPEVGITLTEDGDESGDAKICLVHPEIHYKKHKMEFFSDFTRKKRVRAYKKDMANWVDAISRGVFDDEWLARGKEISVAAGIVYKNNRLTANEMCAFR